MTRVMYVLTVGDKKFLKQIFVQVIPQVGNCLKAASHFFVVEKVKQDLDSYLGDKEYTYGMSCESVHARLDMDCYADSDYPKVIEDLTSNGWNPAKE